MKNTSRFSVSFLVGTLLLGSLLTACSCNDQDEETPLARERFLGTYSVNESCPQQYNYNMTVSTSTKNEDVVLIDNFGGYGVLLEGIVSGDVVEIDDSATFFDDNGSAIIANFEGLATLNSSGSVLTLNYKVTGSNGFFQQCTATCVKQ
ncbi:MAG: hypothetical protein SFV52_07760 [Saprospiraceae bacterium]|nr:hypothetical protein [Saprospiraceae bacterium]